MPIPVNIPDLALAGLKKIIARGFEQAAVNVFDDFGDLLHNLWEDFPNVFSMLDRLFQFSTGLIGRLITIPFAGIEGLLIDLARFYGIANRLMTVEQAIRSVTVALGEVVTNLTGTSSSSIESALIQGFARWGWALWKRWTFIQSLTNIKSYEDFVRIFIDKFRNRGRFLGVALFVVALFSSIAWTGALAVLMGLALAMVTGEFQKLLLPQDSTRKWRKKGAVHRVNSRRGHDGPSP